MLFGLRTKKVSFTEDDLYYSGNGIKVYTPNTPESLQEVYNIASESIKIKDIKDEEEKNKLTIEIMVKYINLLTNIDITVDEYIKFSNKGKYRIKFITLDNVLGSLLEELMEMLNTKVETLTEDEIKEINKKNRNDKDVILAQMKENKMERKAKEIEQQGIDNDNIVIVGEESEDDLDNLTLEELQEIERRETIRRIRKARIHAIQSDLADW